MKPITPTLLTRAFRRCTHLALALGALAFVPLASASITVTNAADSGAGSLRQAVADAAANAGADTIDFDAALSGQTIAFGSQIVVSDADGVTIDASALSGGLTLSSGGTHRLFTVNAGASLGLTGVSVTGGGVASNGGAIDAGGTLSVTDCTFSANSAAVGGAIRNTGTLTATRCTFTGNTSTSNGGALSNEGGGTATVTTCTFSGNSHSGALQGGGAVNNAFSATLMTMTHCTIAGNSTTGSEGGGGIRNRGPLTIGQTLVAQNTATGVLEPDMVKTGGSASVTDLGANLIGTSPGNSGLTDGVNNNLVGTVASPIDPLLGALTTNGGRTQTMALLVGSPAIDAAVGSTATADQRGQLLHGVADIGAYEYLGGTVIVTNAADSGAGSLRQALADTAAASGVNTIVFDPSLSGGTITCGSELVVNDADGVTIDGSALASGLTLSGGGVGRIFSVANGSSLTLRDLTLTGGNGVGAAVNGWGGAIYNAGTTTLLRCTLSGNTAGTTPGGPEGGGAMFNDVGGTLALTQCTVAGNACISNRGGALRNEGTATFTHCTVVGNTARFDSGAFRNEAALTLENSIIFGNTVSDGGPGEFNGAFSVLTVLGANVMATPTSDGVITGSGTANPANPLLGALASNGGRTRTMALLGGSPAIDAAVGSAITNDQRGRPLSGAADIGAYEYRGGTFTVLNTADSGAGSLREAFADAALATGDNTIDFDSSLSGATITLASEIAVADAGGVFVDASGLPAGVTLSGGGTSRILSVTSGSSLELIDLTLTGGNGAGVVRNGDGGAIISYGALSLSRCTLNGNTGNAGGAIYQGGGSLVLTQCTLSGNSATGIGGAVFNDLVVDALFTHCTIAGNTADYGGGLYVFQRSTTLENCILAGNSATTGGADLFNDAAGITSAGVNIIQSRTEIGGGGYYNPGTISNADPLLGPLASNGGPTQTMALLAGSPAIDAAVGSAITSDQRGLPRVGTADIGAVEHQQLVQTITFGPLADRTFGDAPFVVNATANSGQTVGFLIIEGYSGTAVFGYYAGGSAGDNLTINGAGHVTIQATAPAVGDYLAAVSVEQGFTIAKAAQTINFGAIADRTFGDAPFALSATGGASGNPVTFAIASGPASVSGSTLTITGAGLVTVRASQAGNANYFAAADVDQSFTVSQAGQAIAFTLPAKAFTSSTIVLGATASSGLAVSYGIVSGPGSLAGNLLSFTADGEIVVRASQAGNASYTAAADVDRAINVGAIIALDDRAVIGKTDTFIDVLANDSDSTNRPLAVLSVTQPASGGIVSIVGGQIFLKRVGALGSPVTFTYTAGAGSDTATATVSLEPPAGFSGNYIGLLSNGGTVLGRVRLTVNSSGSLTGNVQRDGTTLYFGTTLVGSGRIMVFTSVKTPRILLTLTPGEDDAFGQPTLLATIPAPTAGMLTGTLERSPYDGSHPAPQAGRYTIVGNRPGGGTGPATGVVLTCTVSNAGVATFLGRRGHGGTISSSGRMLAGGRHPFHQGNGAVAVAERLAGEMVFDKTASPAVTGTLRWRVPAGVNARILAGVNQDYTILGMPYTAGATAAAMYSPAALAAVLTLNLPNVPGSPLVLGVGLTGTPARGVQRVRFPFEPVYVDLFPGSGFFYGEHRRFGQPRRPFFGVVVQGAGYNYGQGSTLDGATISPASLSP
ncbi:MAG: right-handed parallel beta-helix repeat-containing protein [Chthoniobacteraceae bacterium]